MSTWSNINSAVVVSPVGQPEYVLVSNSNPAAISVLDIDTRDPNFASYTTHPVTVGEGGRNNTIRVKRLLVFGDGEIFSGFIYIVSNTGRVETYPIGPSNAQPYQGVLVWQECQFAVGDTIYATLVWQGAKVRISQVRWEYVVIR